MNPPTKPPSAAALSIPAPMAASPGAGHRTEMPRRPTDYGIPPARRAGNGDTSAGAPSSGSGPAPTPAKDSDMRRLLVGREIALAGEIRSCDLVLVEGIVEARLTDGRVLEITESGLFKGSAEIDEADISGRFQGKLMVRGRLRVRNSGRIEGTVRYGELEVENGGQLVGNLRVFGEPEDSEVPEAVELPKVLASASARPRPVETPEPGPAEPPSDQGFDDQSFGNQSASA